MEISKGFCMRDLGDSESDYYVVLLRGSFYLKYEKISNVGGSNECYFLH